MDYNDRNRNRDSEDGSSDSYRARRSNRRSQQDGSYSRSAEGAHARTRRASRSDGSTSSRSARRASDGSSSSEQRVRRGSASQQRRSAGQRRSVQGSEGVSERSRSRSRSQRQRDQREAASSDSQQRSLERANNTTRAASSVDASAYSRAAASERYTAQRASSGNGGKKRKIIIGAVAVVLVALIVAGVAFANWFNRVSSNISSDEDVELTAEVADEPYYVLLLGSDSRGEEATEDDAGNRTDSIMVARVDEQEQSVHLLSIPRDTRVWITAKNNGEGGYDKINSAYAYGDAHGGKGLQSTIDTVEGILDIKISYYAFIYFDGFEQIVDTLGGVTVAVPEGTYYAGTWVPAGDAVTINGEEALVLARCRHGYPEDQGAYASGDYQRTINQRNLVKAIARKVLDQDVTQYPSLVESLSSCLETNMSVTKLISLATTMKGMDVDNMDAYSIPVCGLLADGSSCCGIYEDIFEVLQPNFVNGRDIMYGMDNYNWYAINYDMTNYYTDGPLYSYAMYRDTPFGEFLSSTDTTSTSGTESTDGTTTATTTVSSGAESSTD